MVSTDPRDVLLRRARRARDKGDFRGAAIALRELIALEDDAKTWAMLGAMLARARRTDDAIRAFRQSLWLHGRGGADRRARTVARLLVTFVPDDEKLARLAA